MSLILIIVLIFIVMIAIIILNKADLNVLVISLVSLMFTFIYLCRNNINSININTDNKESNTPSLNDSSLDVDIEQVPIESMPPQQGSTDSHQNDISGTDEEVDTYALDTDDEYYNKFGTAQEGEWAGGDQFQKHYFGKWGSNQEYTNCYKQPSWEMNRCNMYSDMSIDERVAQQAKMRNKENRVLDGWTSKNMNYYKKHFADELEIEEAKPWWGDSEY